MFNDKFFMGIKSSSLTAVPCSLYVRQTRSSQDKDSRAFPPGVEFWGLPLLVTLSESLETVDVVPVLVLA